jgi:t-SNARE complex subunit (syntaxin)
VQLVRGHGFHFYRLHLAVALYGMDGRTHKTMALFIQGPCKSIAQIVDEPEANVDIIDADAMDARVTLDHCLAESLKSTPLIIPIKLEKFCSSIIMAALCFAVFCCSIGLVKIFFSVANWK